MPGRRLPVLQTVDLDSLKRVFDLVEDRLSTLEDGGVGQGVALSGALVSEAGLVNDLPLGAGVVFEVSSPQAVTLTGLAGGFDGRAAVLWNVGTTTLTLAHESQGSLDLNRITARAGASYALGANAAVLLLYSKRKQRWVIMTAVA